MDWSRLAIRWPASWRRGCSKITDAAFCGADMSTKLKLMGVDVASLGDAHAATVGARTCSFVDERRQIYKKLVLSADGQRLLGGILIGEAEEYGTLLQTMQNGLPLPERAGAAHPAYAIDGRACFGAWRWRAARRRPDLLLQQCQQGRALRGGGGRRYDAGSAQEMHTRGHSMRWLRAAGCANSEGGTREAEASRSTITCASISAIRDSSCFT